MQDSGGKPKRVVGMTWDEFVETIEKQFAERSLPRDAPIRFIDWNSDLLLDPYLQLESGSLPTLCITED